MCARKSADSLARQSGRARLRRCGRTLTHRPRAHASKATIGQHARARVAQHTRIDRAGWSMGRQRRAAAVVEWVLRANRRRVLRDNTERATTQQPVACAGCHSHSRRRLMSKFDFVFSSCSYRNRAPKVHKVHHTTGARAHTQSRPRRSRAFAQLSMRRQRPFMSLSFIRAPAIHRAVALVTQARARARAYAIWSASVPLRVRACVRARADLVAGWMGAHERRS